jgi:hypothetical protein
MLASTKILQAGKEVFDRSLLRAARLFTTTCGFGAAGSNWRTRTTIPREPAAAEGYAQQERSKYNLGIH